MYPKLSALPHMAFVYPLWQSILTHLRKIIEINECSWLASEPARSVSAVKAQQLKCKSLQLKGSDFK